MDTSRATSVAQAAADNVTAAIALHVPAVLPDALAMMQRYGRASRHDA
jgi:hypothetical protein